MISYVFSLFIKAQLIYNVLSIPAVQQSNPVIHTHTHTHEKPEAQGWGEWRGGAKTAQPTKGNRRRRQEVRSPGEELPGLHSDCSPPPALPPIESSSPHHSALPSRLPAGHRGRGANGAVPCGVQCGPQQVVGGLQPGSWEERAPSKGSPKARARKGQQDGLAPCRL